MPRPDSLLTAAVNEARALLAGKAGRRRWGTFAGIAAMAGIAGVGAPPPPVGLLMPALDTQPVREALSSSPLPAVLLTALGVVLLAFGAVARAFSFALLTGMRSGNPAWTDWRRHLKAGTAHYIWAGLLSAPFYALLFAAEVAATHGLGTRISGQLETATDESAAQLMWTVIGAVLRFFAVLAPWVLLTLPLFVFLYELVLVLQERDGLGPVAAAREVLRIARRPGNQLRTYLGYRILVQFAAGPINLLALLIAVVLSALPSALLGGLGYVLATYLGGPTSSAGAGVMSFFGLLAAIPLYLALCLVLTPLSLTVFGLARAALAEPPTPLESRG